MELNRAKEIIIALAEGIDPTTGEVLPEDSVYNKGDVVRALYTVLSNLDAKKAKKSSPDNAGKPWSKDEENYLIELYNKGFSKKQIAKEFKRTTGSISSRLSRLGLINN